MPRSNWKGVISFGLVSIPIMLVNSENPAEKISFHQIDKRNNGRIQYKRVNAITGKEVKWDDIVKGYIYNKDITIPVEEGELKKVAGENAHTIAIEGFVKEDSIDFIDINKTYYLIPDKKNEKGYVLLRETLKNEKVIGIAKVIISTKEYIAAVSCYQNALVLYILRYHDEIIPVSDLKIPSDNLKKYKVSPKEITAAGQLVKSMTEKWNPKKYKDEFSEIVHKWAEHKIKHKSAVVMGQRANLSDKTKEVNFIELLKKSLSTTKSKHKKKVLAHASKKGLRGHKRATMH